jgi:hypothetical protein
MSNTLPKRPVRFQKENLELLKSMGADYSSVKDKIDYVNDVDVATLPPGVNSSYRTPLDRSSGNKLFRRYLNGVLDMDYACQVVIDAVHRFKQKDIPVYPLERVALQVLFPGHFGDDVDALMAPSVAGVQLDLLPEEQAIIRARVAMHLAEEINWNAGYGGGSVAGRSQTYDR